MAPKMKTVVRHEGKEIVQDHPPALECHFLQIDGETIAAISHCDEDDIVWIALMTNVST